MVPILVNKDVWSLVKLTLKFMVQNCNYICFNLIYTSSKLQWIYSEERKEEVRQEGRGWMREENDMFLFRPTDFFSLGLSVFIINSGLKAGAALTWDTEWGCDDNSFSESVFFPTHESSFMVSKIWNRVTIRLAFPCSTFILNFLYPLSPPKFSLNFLTIILSGLRLYQPEDSY